MVVLRLEKDSYGPLTHGLMNRQVSALVHKACETGSWGDNLDVPLDYCYGCSTLDDLYQWFPEVIFDELLSLGFKLVKYEATEYVVGDNEVAFNRTTSVQLE